MVDERYIIIGRSSCPFCTMAIDFLKCKGRESIFLDYDLDRSILEEYKDFYNQKTVPIIISNNIKSGLVKKIGGYDNLLDHFK